MNLIVLKQTFIGADKYMSDFSKRKCCKYHMIFAVWAVLWAYETLTIYYILNIPINNSIEKAPARLLTIIQSVGTLFLGLIAWKIIADPRSTSENNGTQTDTIDNEESAEVLHHVSRATM